MVKSERPTNERAWAEFADKFQKYDLQYYAEVHGTDKAWHGYCQFYETHLPRNIKQLLEIGVHRGASLKMWADWYKGAKIFGGEFDSNNFYNDEKITTHFVDQRLPLSLKNLIEKIGFCDVIIDDGSHVIQHQIDTLKVLLPHCKYYVLEDLHTSLYKGLKGREYGVHQPNTLTALDYVRQLQGVKSVKIFENYHDNDLSITAIIENA